MHQLEVIFNISKIKKFFFNIKLFKNCLYSFKVVICIDHQVTGELKIKFIRDIFYMKYILELTDFCCKKFSFTFIFKKTLSLT